MFKFHRVNTWPKNIFQLQRISITSKCETIICTICRAQKCCIMGESEPYQSIFVPLTRKHAHVTMPFRIEIIEKQDKKIHVTTWCKQQLHSFFTVLLKMQLQIMWETLKNYAVIRRLVRIANSDRLTSVGSSSDTRQWGRSYATHAKATILHFGIAQRRVRFYLAIVYNNDVAYFWVMVVSRVVSKERAL